MLLFIIKSKYSLLFKLLAAVFFAGALIFAWVNYGEIWPLLLPFLLVGGLLFSARRAINVETDRLITALVEKLSLKPVKETVFNFSPLQRIYLAVNKIIATLLLKVETHNNTLNAISDVVIRTDKNGYISDANQAGLKFFSCDFDELKKHCFAELMSNKAGEDTRDGFKDILENISSDKSADRVYKNTYTLKPGKQTLSIEQDVSGIFDDNGELTGTVIVLRDVTRAEQLRARLRYQANYDSVTKLFNRYKFEQKLMDAWHDAQENKQQHALLQLDMDRFKLINDNAGHAAGDQLLREVGQLLKSAVRQSDICARIGGDEFSILLLGTTKESTLTVMEKLNSAFKQLPFSFHGQVFEVGASIGGTLINHTSPPLVEIKRQADAACFMAKNKGINRCQLFDDNDESLVIHQQEPRWAARIHQALENDEFELFFQPIKALNTQANTKQHLEILLRLKSDNQYLSPSVFLPAVERFRLTDKVDAWVVNKAFSWLSQHPELWGEIVISINLSGESVTNTALIDHILTLHQDLPFPSAAVCFEITETAAIANMSKATTMVEKLRFAGFAIALDDFGKGFSTFSYLKNLPAKYIKIDGSYVQDVLNNQSDLAIVKAINSLAKTLDMYTIAEFVQCEQAMSLLNEIGVDFVQGYGIARPRPLAEYHTLANVYEAGGDFIGDSFSCDAAPATCR
ncbi:EAL domain-containing protein [Thalassomonas actiniarum]|uniref:EAL domain-containing protein n=1 Tax=Thalassomonas actiniarum TaxID=485447 RepID=A0AAE9YSD5_9GAMM|nr:EAL domain-containing protein [Thalassomonas actiniarum]WDE00356.1 EAL domain-containing protein [Thalassomonas actiniarum]